MKITIEKLGDSLQILSKVDTNINDKLSEAIKYILEEYKNIVTPRINNAKRKIQNARFKFAQVNNEGTLIVNEPSSLSQDGLVFTPEGRISLEEKVYEINDALQLEEVEFEGDIIDPTQPGYERTSFLFNELDRKKLTGILF